jgi:hypothetical protein
MTQPQRDSYVAAAISSLQPPEPRRKRSRVDLTREEEESDDDGKVPPAIVPILSTFPGIPREPIAALYDNTFRPKKDLIKLRTPEFRASVPEGDSFEYKNTSSGVKLRQVASLKDWGHDASLWVHCFSNYIAIWGSLFSVQHPRVMVGMVLFLRYVCDISKIYHWQDAVLPLALNKHQMLIDRGILTIPPEDWAVEPSVANAYLRPDMLLLSKPASTPAPPSSSKSSRNTTPNNNSVFCEKFNSSGCNWSACKRKHQCSLCSGEHSAIHCKSKKA